MRSAFALRIFSGKNIYNFAFVALCGALQTHFHGRGLYPLRRLRASSPKGTPFGYTGKFATAAKAVPLGKVA